MVDRTHQDVSWQDDAPVDDAALAADWLSTEVDLEGAAEISQGSVFDAHTVTVNAQ